MTSLRRFAVVAWLLCMAAPASAHVALLSPRSRYGEDILKQAPCGLAGGPRSENVTVLQPGAQLEVMWDEYVDHPGHFRIAFDADGDDDFVDPVCVSGCDTTMPVFAPDSNPSVLLDGIADTVGGGISRATITLPDIECERCTLQLIQVMYDKPPYRSPGNDIYYQCADLILRAAPLPCAGDCDHSGAVTVNELVSAVEISLGAAALSDCPAVDRDGSGDVTIAELVDAVDAALNGCPSR